MENDAIKARPVGRILRLTMGIAMVILGGRPVFENDIRLAGLVLAVIVGEFLFYLSMHLVIVRLFTSINRWMGAMLAVSPVFAVYILSDAPGQLGSVLFVGISLILSAIRADGGCEVMTLPGMLLGRRTHLVCIAFSPIDWAEERLYSLFSGASTANDDALT